MNSFALISLFCLLSVCSYVDCCNETNNEAHYFCMNCRRTCQTKAKADEEPPIIGCGCRDGFIMDERSNTCVALNIAPEECNVTALDFNFGFIFVEFNDTSTESEEELNTTEVTTTERIIDRGNQDTTDLVTVISNSTENSGVVFEEGDDEDESTTETSKMTETTENTSINSTVLQVNGTILGTGENEEIDNDNESDDSDEEEDSEDEEENSDSEDAIESKK